jgi:hypothetical protein
VIQVALNNKIMMTRTAIELVLLAVMAMAFYTLPAQTTSNSRSTVVKKGAKYDTIIRKHVDKPVVKAKPAQKQVVQEVVPPVPEFVNQPCYYDKNGNKLITLETTTAQLVTKKKTLGLKEPNNFLVWMTCLQRFGSSTGTALFFSLRQAGGNLLMPASMDLFD